MAGTYTRDRSPRMEAAEAGRLRYYTGRPCLNGHDSERYTKSGACCRCQALGVLAQQQRIKAAILAAQEA